MKEVRPCAFPHCTNPGCVRLGKGSPDERLYCKTHHHQWWIGRELAPIQPYMTFDDPEGLRKCSGCMEIKSVDEFYMRTSGYLQRRCKDCMIAHNRQNTIDRRSRQRV
jgi:hypothetical protein